MLRGGGFQQCTHRRNLPAVASTQFAGTSLRFAINAVVPDLQRSAGRFTAAVQLGFIAGTLVFAPVVVAERFSPRRGFPTCRLRVVGGNDRRFLGARDRMAAGAGVAVGGGGAGDRGVVLTGVVAGGGMGCGLRSPGASQRSLPLSLNGHFRAVAAVSLRGFRRINRRPRVLLATLGA